MTEPAPKRVKVENGLVNNPKHPILFEVPRLSVPDVRLTVMDQQFLVHSAILKSKSGFFDKLFEWPGSMDWSKTAEYKYDLHTSSSSSSDWDLQVCDSTRPAAEYTAWTSYEVEIPAFYKLLMALYGKPFNIKDWKEFSKMTDLAERFKALPCLSSNLPVIYSTSPCLLESIDGNAHIILPIAIKLRDAVLFRECIVFIANPWSLEGARIANIEDPGLRELARAAYDNIDLNVGKALHSLIHHFGNPTYKYSTVLHNSALEALSTSTKQVLFPHFFRGLFRGRDPAPDLAKLLENNSVLVCRRLWPERES